MAELDFNVPSDDFLLSKCVSNEYRLNNLQSCTDSEWFSESNNDLSTIILDIQSRNRYQTSQKTQWVGLLGQITCNYDRSPLIRDKCLVCLVSNQSYVSGTSLNVLIELSTDLIIDASLERIALQGLTVLFRKSEHNTLLYITLSFDSNSLYDLTGGCFLQSSCEIDEALVSKLTRTSRSSHKFDHFSDHRGIICCKCDNITTYQLI
jgi:hypothetical protein